MCFNGVGIYMIIDCSTFTAPLQHIYSIIAAHFSTRTFQHNYSTFKHILFSHPIIISYQARCKVWTPKGKSKPKILLLHLVGGSNLLRNVLLVINMYYLYVNFKLPSINLNFVIIVESHLLQVVNSNKVSTKSKKILYTL